MDVLIVAAGPDAHVQRALSQLAPDNVRVIAVDGGASHCARAGVVPDLIVGDMDSIDRDTLDRFATSGVALSTHPPEKDLTDLDLALEVVREHERADRLVLTGITGGRTDHALAALGTLARFVACKPEVVERSASGAILGIDGRHSIEIEQNGAVVSVIPLGDEAVVSGHGLRYPLDHLRLRALDSRGLSNVVDDPPAVVELESGTVLVWVLTPPDAQY